MASTAVLVADEPVLLRRGVTSAAYFAERETDGGRVTPIVDPESGVAIDSRRSVTVLAPECLYADALTKPVLLSGMTTAAFLARFSARAVVLG